MTQTKSVQEIVVSLIARHKGLETTEIEFDADLADLGVTSLDAITLAYELEGELGLEIPNADIESLRTVQDLIDSLSRLIAAKQ